MESPIFLSIKNNIINIMFNTIIPTFFVQLRMKDFCPILDRQISKYFTKSI